MSSEPAGTAIGETRAEATYRPRLLPPKVDRSCRKIPQAACHQAGIEFPVSDELNGSAAGRRRFSGISFLIEATP
jgi:hypothetical protein